MIKTIWEKTKVILKKIAAFQSKVLLSIIYFIFITPVAVLFKIFSGSSGFESKASWSLKVENEKQISQLRNQ